MELRNGPISVFKLIFNALKIANQAFGSVLVLFILLLIMIALVLAVLFGIYQLSGPRVVMLAYIPVSISFGFLNIAFSTAIIQILAAKMEKRGYSAWDGFADALLPTVYLLASSIILGVPVFILFFAAQLSHSPTVVLIFNVAVFFATLPFIFTQQVLALRNEGPISALRYSWELGTRHYVRILFTLFTMALCFTFVILAASCAVKAFAPQLLLWLSAHVNPFFFLTSPVQALALVVVFYAICLFIYMTMQATLTGLFLNLDYSSRTTESRQLDVQANLTFEPAEPANNMESVSVTQESIRTGNIENADHHLDKVYKAQDHLAQAIEQEEDRMPTILFDEDMARQLAATEEEMRRQQEQAVKNKEDNEPKSVKMSDNPL